MSRRLGLTVAFLFALPLYASVTGQIVSPAFPNSPTLRAVATLSSFLPVVSPRDYALGRMKESGISADLMALMDKVYLPEERDKLVALNVLGFLGKADYSGHYSKRALRKTAEFMRKHRRSLRQAEKKYGVPATVIASLIWVETKLGAHLGSHNVPHVYFSLLQADHPLVVQSTLIELQNREPDQIEVYRQKVWDRSATKSNWALKQLQALDEIQRSGNRMLDQLMGSYAGAFGIPQFIPSSYLQWSKPGTKGGSSADLFAMDDAITSVAFYLKSNGWQPRDSESHRAALFHYNRAEGYVSVILKLASALDKKGI